MNGMFSGCSSLKELDISNFSFINPFGIKGMLEECSDELKLKIKLSSGLNLFGQIGI